MMKYIILLMIWWIIIADMDGIDYIIYQWWWVVRTADSVAFSTLTALSTPLTSTGERTNRLVIELSSNCCSLITWVDCNGLFGFGINHYIAVVVHQRWDDHNFQILFVGMEWGLIKKENKNSIIGLQLF